MGVGGLSGGGNVALVTTDASPKAVALSVGGNGANNSFSGTLGGAGSLVKNGNDLLFLNGSSTYQGGTTLNAGSLVVANTAGSALGSGILTLNAGTLAAGPAGGTIGGLVQGGANPHTIAPGAGLPTGQYGTLNLNGGLSANSNTTLLFNLGGPVSGGNYSGDLINLGGAGLSGAGNINFVTDPTANGDYRLFGGTLGNPNLGSFSLPYESGWSYSLSTTADPGYLDLVVASAGAYSGTSTWTSSTSGSWTVDGNWDSRGPQNPGEVGRLRWCASSTIAVSLDGPQTAGILVFSSSGKGGYVITPGANGTLTLDNYGLAQILVNSGTHAISAPVILPASLSIIPSAGTTLTISGDISEQYSGYGLLSLDGPGMLILSGTNSYTGGTQVNAGTLDVTNPSALADGTSLSVGANAASIFALAGPVGGSSLAGSSLAAVPESGTLALLAVGLGVGFGVWRRRKGH